MLTLIRQGIVENGSVRIIGTQLPEGTRVVVLARQLLSIQEQAERLEAIPLDEWSKSFDELVELAHPGPQPEADIESVSDQELEDVVHQVRSEMKAE